MPSQVFTTTGSQSWTWVAGATQVTVEALGGGGAGGAATGNPATGGGGKGGTYIRHVITKGVESALDILVGSGGVGGASNGGNGASSIVTQNGVQRVVAGGGAGGTAGTVNSTNGAAGTSFTNSNIGDFARAGGNGGVGNFTSGTAGSGAGGGSAGSSTAGGAASVNVAGATGTGAFLNGIEYSSAGAAGVGDSTAGANAPASANDYGGGGSGGKANANPDRNGGSGRQGIVVLTWTIPVTTPLPITGSETPTGVVSIVKKPRTNLALASGGGIATATSSYDAAYGPEKAINGVLHAQGAQVLWNSAAGLPQTWEVDLGGPKLISWIDVVTQGDDYNQNFDPPLDQTFSLFGLTAYNVDYFDGTSWHPVATVTGNYFVWGIFAFNPVFATKVRVVCLSAPDGYARLWEVRVWGGFNLEGSVTPSGVLTPRKNYINAALQINGGVASASSYHAGPPPYLPAKTNDGIRHTEGAFYGWNSGADPSPAAPEWLMVELDREYTLSEVNVIGLKDSVNYVTDPALGEIGAAYANRDFKTQYWNGSAWVDVDVVTDNDQVWRQFFWSNIVTQKVRTLVTRAEEGFARLVELEAWGTPAPVVNLVGTVTPSGSFRLLASQKMTASLATAGAIRRLSSIVTSGAVAPASTLAFLQSRFLSFIGTVTPVGSLTSIKGGILNLVALVTPSATLRGFVSQKKTAALPMSGTAKRVASAAHSGVVTPIGSLTSSAASLLNLVGQVIPVGLLQNYLSMKRSGALPTASSIKKRIETSLASIVTPLGDLFASVGTKLLSVAGTVAPVSSLLSAVTTKKTAALTLAGSARRRTYTLLTGDVTPAAILDAVKVVTGLVLNLAGTVTPAGSLVKTIGKRFTSLVESIGLLLGFEPPVIEIPDTTGRVTVSHGLVTICKARAAQIYHVALDTALASGVSIRDALLVYRVTATSSLAYRVRIGDALV